jgi:hypothetical protein
MSHRFLLTILIVSLADHIASGQALLSHDIHGSIYDAVSKKPCAFAAISILRLDSSLLRFARAEQDGNWIIRGVPPGTYILFISYPQYAEYYMLVNIRDSSAAYLGTVIMQARSELLQSVSVVAKPYTQRMRSDTLVFGTSNLKLKLSATVEDLLSRLPGLFIDATGKITYNGEKIERLLVDGEDIFQSDPTMVTRNFDASKIAEVEVLNGKSDQTIFTGLDNGVRTKTINLVMKQSVKDGYFGKIEAAGNTAGYYNGNGMLAGFWGKEQFTAIGQASNTGTVGFSNEAGGSTASIDYSNITPDPLNTSAGIGIPQFISGALHYANSWNGTQNHIMSNYQYSHYLTEPLTTVRILQRQSYSIYRQQQYNNSSNHQDQHWIYGTYDWMPDQRSGIKLEFNLKNALCTNQFTQIGRSTFNDTLVNTSQRYIQDKTHEQNVSSNLAWRIQVGKRSERMFSANIGFEQLDNTVMGYVQSTNQFYHTDGSADTTESIDQRKTLSSHSLAKGGGLTYTEPIGRRARVGLGYGLQIIQDQPMQNTFDRGDGSYQKMVDSLSSKFQTRTINNNASLSLQGNLNHLSYSLGNDWIWYDYRQSNASEDSESHYRFVSMAPRLNFTLTPNPELNVGLYYYALALMPSNTQLQPIINNSDPLHIVIGNPGLHPGTSQNFRLDFRRLKALITTISLNFSITSNSISTKTITDSLGRQITQSVNVNGAQTAGLNVSLNKIVAQFNAGFHALLNYARVVNYVNADLNHSDNYLAGAGITLNRYVANAYAVRLNTQFTYVDSRTSVNPGAIVQYWSQNHSGSLGILFIRRFEINTNAVYTWQQSINHFSGNTSVLLWNASAVRNLLDGKLRLQFQINNLMDKNIGVGRTNIENITTETSTNIMGRYFMLSLTYRFNKQAPKKTAN